MRGVKAEDCPAGTSRIVLCRGAVAGRALGTSEEGCAWDPVPLRSWGLWDMPLGLVFPQLIGRKIINCLRFFRSRDFGQ